MADLFSLLIAAIIFAGTLGVVLVNGPKANGAFLENDLLTIDTNYMFAFIEQARAKHAYPSQNPFVPNCHSSYPALLHCGLGALADQDTRPAILSMWWIFPFFTMPTALLLYALWDRRPIVHSRFAVYIVFVLALFFISIRPDLVAYIQTQCLVLPFFMLYYWCLGSTSWTGPRMILSAGLLLMLVAMHTVVGMAAILFFCAEAASSFQVWKSHRFWTLAITGTVFFSSALFLIINHQTAPAMLGNSMQPDAARLFGQSTNNYLAMLGIAASVCFFGWKDVPWRICAALLFSIGLAYGIFGLYCNDAWNGAFAVFNSSRFYLFAWLAIAPAFLRLPFWPALLLIVSPVVITPSWSGMLSVYNGIPTDLSASIPAYQFIRTHIPTDTLCAENGILNTGLSAFTGRVSFIRTRVNYFATGMITPQSWADLMIAHKNIYDEKTTPSARSRMLTKYNISCVLASARPTNPATARWLPDNWKVIFSDKNVVVWVHTSQALVRS